MERPGLIDELSAMIASGINGRVALPNGVIWIRYDLNSDK